MTQIPIDEKYIEIVIKILLENVPPTLYLKVRLVTGPGNVKNYLSASCNTTRTWHQPHNLSIAWQQSTKCNVTICNANDCENNKTWCKISLYWPNNSFTTLEYDVQTRKACYKHITTLKLRRKICKTRRTRGSSVTISTTRELRLTSTTDRSSQNNIYISVFPLLYRFESRI